MHVLLTNATILQGGPKSKPLPNDQKSNEIKFIVKLKCKSSTIILLVGIRYSIRDLLSGLINHA